MSYLGKIRTERYKKWRVVYRKRHQLEKMLYLCKIKKKIIILNNKEPLKTQTAMKKIVLMMAMMIATMTVSASNILYFTYNQAVRTVTCLNNQNELMIYCGYPDELPTYVIINEVWAEQISSSFYEIWLYGFDAYTGEEIYMPIDLDCIYLMQNHSIYSAAQFLRFRHTRPRPKFVWAMPPYNPFVRLPRPKVYYYTYHYDIHRPGWHWTHYPHITYHPYYRRLPSHPAPIPHKPYTPGRERPGYNTACRSQVPVQNDPLRAAGCNVATSITTCHWWATLQPAARKCPCRTTPPPAAATASQAKEVRPMWW